MGTPPPIPLNRFSYIFITARKYCSAETNQIRSLGQINSDKFHDFSISQISSVEQLSPWFVTVFVILSMGQAFSHFLPIHDFLTDFEFSMFFVHGFSDYSVGGVIVVFFNGFRHYSTDFVISHDCSVNPCSLPRWLDQPGSDFDIRSA